VRKNINCDTFIDGLENDILISILRIKTKVLSHKSNVIQMCN
jgi:hypothetical protein